MKLLPFAAVHPQPEVAARVAAVPWDVLSDEEARALAEANPLSFVAIDRPEVNFGADEHPSPADAAARAAGLLDVRAAAGTFVRDSAAAYWLYRLTSAAGHVQTGVAGVASLREYEEGAIRTHEQVREPKVADRVAHIMALRGQASPVYLFYRDNAAVDALMPVMTLGQPFFDVTDAEGTRHQLWRVARPDALGALHAAFETVPAFYVADGHHRAAAAARVAERLGARPGATGQEAWNGLLVVAFPASQVNIEPYRLPDATDASAEAATVEQVMACADAGECMPPKSTWFTPKPASGLLLHRW